MPSQNVGAKSPRAGAKAAAPARNGVIDSSVQYPCPDSFPANAAALIFRPVAGSCRGFTSASPRRNAQRHQPDYAENSRPTVAPEDGSAARHGTLPPCAEGRRPTQRPPMLEGRGARRHTHQTWPTPPCSPLSSLALPSPHCGQPLSRRFRNARKFPQCHRQERLRCLGAMPGFDSFKVHFDGVAGQDGLGHLLPVHGFPVRWSK